MGFDYESCMLGCFGESYSDAASSPSDWAGDGDSFLLERKVAAQRARRAGGGFVPDFGDAWTSAAERQQEQEQAEIVLLQRIIRMRGDHGSALRNRWADQLLLDLECSAEGKAGDYCAEAYTRRDSSCSEQLSEGSETKYHIGSSSGSDAFGSTVAFDGDASFEDEARDRMNGLLAQSDCSDGSSDCTDVDAQADSLLERVAKLSPEDAELAGLVEESIRTLDTLRQAIASADAATGTALDRKRCDELCAQHKAGGNQCSPPISPTSPLDCFATGQQFMALRPE
jgi:hypothetical protein